MNKYLFLLTCVFAFSCKKNVPQALQAIDRLEQEYDKNKDPKTLESLLAEYINFVTGNAGDKAQKIEILEKAEKLSASNNRYFESVTFLNTLIKEDPESAKNPDRILQLADLMKNVIRNENAANTLYTGFLDKYPQHPKSPEVQKIIGDQHLPLKTMIQNLAGKMYDDTLHQFNETAATQYVDATEAYVLINPDDPESPDLLNKAAETARSLKTFNKAISLYDWVIEKYPTSKLASQALFLKAFTFDNELHDIENAKFYYEEFIKRYPTNDFADDAKVLMDNLGKSDQEFLQSIQGEKK
ncbi:MAG: tetratricopeptide repeat protein [Saprospiraceae bacterium]|nr:tetratricopeptide repeat protein [Saprospiraceae bacterium]MBK8279238.1 tetratricopeptide repeat protein [Saprospiraceae bacterium]MBK8511558.1 tetratricopeptide repeat protein [Saprospiraceae bacterium]MBL0113771.1 tetratricopeptide repeat protein [Saprospiraceae bacterium]MBP7802581.1 tetratricopeptide repeat protein [Saprospiraceae bacterium]